MAEFPLKIKDFEDAPKEYRFAVSSVWLAGQLEGTDLSADPQGPEGEVTITASKSGEDVVIQGGARARLVAPCARCLEEVALDLEADLTMLMVRASTDSAQEVTADLTPEELAKETYTGDEIHLDEIVRENLILEVPMQVHCTDPACVARWDGAGASAKRAPDPRLAGLAALRHKLSSGSGQDGQGGES